MIEFKERLETYYSYILNFPMSEKESKALKVLTETKNSLLDKIELFKDY